MVSRHVDASTDLCILYTDLRNHLRRVVHGSHLVSHIIIINHDNNYYDDVHVPGFLPYGIICECLLSRSVLAVGCSFNFRIQWLTLYLLLSALQVRPRDGFPLVACVLMLELAQRIT